MAYSTLINLVPPFPKECGCKIKMFLLWDNIEQIVPLTFCPDREWL